jgi:hypothetical protein
LKIPNADKAIISPEKLREYLLSPLHPVGRFKASYFKELGYSTENWETLQDDLRKQAISDNAVEIEGFPYGRKFVITGSLMTPSSKVVKITTVWVILRGEATPRFITAYPGE